MSRPSTVKDVTTTDRAAYEAYEEATRAMTSGSLGYLGRKESVRMSGRRLARDFDCLALLRAHVVVLTEIPALLNLHYEARRIISSVARHYPRSVVITALAQVTSERPAVGEAVARTLYKAAKWPRRTPKPEDSATHRRRHVPENLSRDVYDKVFQSVGPTRTEFLTQRLRHARPRLTPQQHELGCALAGEWALTFDELIDTTRGLCPTSTKRHR